jgi:hypothetical protein
LNWDYFGQWQPIPNRSEQPLQTPEMEHYVPGKPQHMTDQQEFSTPGTSMPFGYPAYSYPNQPTQVPANYPAYTASPFFGQNFSYPYSQPQQYQPQYTQQHLQQYPQQYTQQFTQQYPQQNPQLTQQQYMQQYQQQYPQLQPYPPQRYDWFPYRGV